MTIDEAIKILQVRTQSRPLLGKHEVYGAIQLGIEALKRHQVLQSLYPDFNEPPLPGETEE